MAKLKTQLNTTSSASTSVPPSSVPDNCIGDSNIAVLRPSQGTTVDKTDTSSSRNISISSINEDDNNDSSAFESSDSECDDEQIKKAIDRIPNSLQPGSQLVQNGMLVVKDDNNSPVSTRGPNIGSIAVHNSSDITFGNKTYIKGQVVIKNIYHDKKNGSINNGYHETDGELGSTIHNKDSAKPKDLPSWRSSLKVIIKDKPMLSVIILIVVMLIVVTLVIVAYTATAAGNPIYKRNGDGDDDRAYVPPDTGIDKDFIPEAKPLRIVTRNEWLAQPPKEVLTPLNLPVNRVIIAHTATEGCHTQTACVYRVRNIQELHIGSMNFGDIGYNFLIGGDGNVYEGRGWLSVGAFLRGQNSKSEGIAFIGNYNNMEPTDDQIEALDALLDRGVKGNYLTPDFKLFGARQFQLTDSPGHKLYKRLQEHMRWSDNLPAQCSFMMVRIQEFHMADDSKNYSDIAYNFLVGGDGNAYVGRDWDKQGAHTKGFNVDSICIAFIGTFTDIEPSIIQLSAAEQLIAMGFQDKKLSKTYRLYGHRQLAPFESPGRMLYKIIQKWPHWSNELGSNHWIE